LGSSWKLNHDIIEGIRRKVGQKAGEAQCDVMSSLPNPSSYKHKFSIKPTWIVSSQRVCGERAEIPLSGDEVLMDGKMLVFCHFAELETSLKADIP
jgi:hypothetical protein